jgi:hypothetical protein
MSTEVIQISGAVCWSNRVMVAVVSSFEKCLEYNTGSCQSPSVPRLVTHDDAPPVLDLRAVTRSGAYRVAFDSSGLIANILRP